MVVNDAFSAADQRFDEMGDDAIAFAGGGAEESFEGCQEAEADRVVRENFPWGEEEVGFGDFEGLADAVGAVFVNWEERRDEGEEGW